MFAGPIYLEYFNIKFKILDTSLVLLSFYFILKSSRKTLFFTGFFTGIFWFYWISLSFRFYDLTYLIPLVILLLGLAYGLLFLLIGLKENVYLKALIFFALSFLNPFAFDWFKPELLLVNSYFEANKTIFALIIVATVFLTLKKYIIYPIIIAIALFLNLNPKASAFPKLNISMPKLEVKQNEKWDKKNLSSILNTNLSLINKAIMLKKDVIILPETAFPMVLNKSSFVLQNLIEKSRYITIVTGAMFYDGKNYRNSTYIIKNGKLTVAHKVVLVPFGEAVPFPEKVANFINDVFYDGARDFKEASKATDFKIKNSKFRNAICYEATSEKIYENLKDVKNIIVTSNNAWFTPSIEPSLQKMLLKLYSSKYGVNIIHQVNGSENYIIQAN